MNSEVPRATIPVTIALIRRSSWLVKMVRIPPNTAKAKATMQAPWRMSCASLLTLMKKEIRNTTPTMEPMVCLSLFLLTMAARPPITAMIKEATERKFCTFANILFLN